MAARVNKPFVVVLSAALLLVAFGVAFLAYRQLEGGERHIRKGDALLAESSGQTGEAQRDTLRRASASYARGVSKDRTRVDWIEKWMAALKQVHPRTPTEYSTMYRADYVNILRTLAELEPEDAWRTVAYLEELWRGYELTGGQIAYMQHVQDEARRLVDRMTDKGSVGAARAESFYGLAVVERMGQVEVSAEERGRALEAVRKSYEVTKADPETPTDWRSGLAVVQWHEAEVSRQRLAGDTAGVIKSTAAAAEACDALLADITAAKSAAGADASAGELAGWELNVASVRLAQVAREAVTGLSMDDATGFQRIVDQVRATPAAGRVLSALRSVASSPGGGHAMSAGLRRLGAAGLVVMAGADAPVALADAAESAWRGSGGDLAIALVAGQVLEGAERHERSMEVYQSIVDAEARPVSLEGMVLDEFRRLAVFNQLGSLLAMWQDQPGDATAVEAIRGRVSAKRDELSKLVSSGNESLLRIREGQVAFLEKRYADAVGILSGLRAQLDMNSTMMLADSLLKTGRAGDAQVVLEELSAGQRASGRDTANLRLSLAEVSAQLRDWDTAMEHAERACAIAPSSAEPHLRVVDIARRRILAMGLELEGDSGAAREAAAGRARAALEVLESQRASLASSDPAASEALAARVGQARAALDEAVGLADSETARAIAEATKLSRAGRTEDAVALLEGELAARDEVALWRAVVSIAGRTTDLGRARELAKRAVAAHPDDEVLKGFERSLSFDDELSRSLAAIEEDAGLTAVQKDVLRAQVYARWEKVEEAKAAVAAAVAAAPKDPQVIAIAFELAVATGELKEAERLAGVAATENADQVGGLLYQGRLELVKGQYRAAADRLEQAVAKQEFNPQAWWLLGKAREGLGQTGPALTAFERAHRGQPDEVMIALDYARALWRSGRGGEALAVIDTESGVMRFGGGTPQVRDLWLRLEAEFGDRVMAKREREKVFKLNPGDLSNAEQYIGLLMEDAQWVESGEAINTLQQTAGVPEMAWIGARADWYAKQGEYGQGIRLFEDYLNGIPEAELEVTPILEFARFLRRNHAAGEQLGENVDLLKASVTIYERARKYESDAKEVSRELADVLVQLAAARTSEDGVISAEGQEFLRSAKGMMEAVASGTGSTPADTLRRAQVELLLGDPKSAGARLDGDKALEADSEQVLILRSKIAAASGDKRAAREVADRAVGLYPSSPQVFLHRALLNKDEASLFADVVKDLEQVTRLDPAGLAAWHQRFRLYMDRGDVDTAFLQLRQAVTANPSVDDLRAMLIRRLEESGRISEAVEEAKRAARDRAEDIEWLSVAATLCERHGLWREAAQLYEGLFTKLSAASDPRKPDAAAAWLNAMVRMEGQPQRETMVKLLLEMPEETEQDLRLLLLRAKALRRLGNDSDALIALSQAFALVRNGDARGTPADDSRAMMYWVQEADVVTGDRAATLEHARQLAKPSGLPLVLRVLEASASPKAGDPRPGPEDRLARLAALESEVSADGVARFALLDARADALLELGRYAEAVEPLEQASKLEGADAETLNNLAYVLAAFLDRPAEALPFAERAVALAPGWSSARDTLGTVHLKVEPPRLADAERELLQAVKDARSADERAAANLHLGQAYLKLGRLKDADDAARRAEAAVGEIPGGGTQYSDELRMLQEAIRGR